MLMFSLAGIPPLAGFLAKWYVFLPAIKAGLYPLAVIGVVTSVVGAFYYLRIVKIMFFDEPRQPSSRATTTGGNGALGGCSCCFRAASGALVDARSRPRHAIDATGVAVR